MISTVKVSASWLNEIEKDKDYDSQNMHYSVESYTDKWLAQYLLINIS